MPPLKALAGRQEGGYLLPTPARGSLVRDAYGTYAACGRLTQPLVRCGPPQGEYADLFGPDRFRHDPGGGVVTQPRRDAGLVELDKLHGAAGPLLKEPGGDLVLADGLRPHVAEEVVVGGIR